MSSVQDIITRRGLALVRIFKDIPYIQLQVAEKEKLRRLAYIRESLFLEMEAEPEQLGRRNPDRVVIIDSKSNPDLNASVWVTRKYYSAKSAYIGFLKQIYGVQATRDDLDGYDADHLRNKARAPTDETFMRVEMSRSDVNQRWGALFEKAASTSGRFKAPSRVMNYMICAKLGGQMPPNGPNDQAGILRLVDFFVNLNFDRKEVLHGIENMMNVAYHKFNS